MSWEPDPTWLLSLPSFSLHIGNILSSSGDYISLFVSLQREKMVTLQLSFLSLPFKRTLDV